MPAFLHSWTGQTQEHEAVGETGRSGQSLVLAGTGTLWFGEEWGRWQAGLVDIWRFGRFAGLAALFLPLTGLGLRLRPDISQ